MGLSSIGRTSSQTDRWPRKVSPLDSASIDDGCRDPGVSRPEPEHRDLPPLLQDRAGSGPETRIRRDPVVSRVAMEEILADDGDGVVPGSEAHGGYRFCGLVAMPLMNEVNRLDLQILLDWMVFRQRVEGGFQGRTNKFVDDCYSFGQGGIAAILQRVCLDATDCESSFGSNYDES